MRAPVLLLAASVTATPASADWIYDTVESAFGDEAVHIAFVDNVKTSGFVFRCKRGSDFIEVIYIVPSASLADDAYALLNQSMPVLRLRVDDEPIVDTDAEIFDAGGRPIVVAGTDKEMLFSIRQAKGRLAVALQLGGKNYYEQSFDTNGSRSVIDRVLSGCGLRENDPML